MKTLLILLLITALLFAGAVYEASYHQRLSHRSIPKCQEDAVLVGAGEFENGTWDYYQCGPAFDDYQP